MEKILFIFYMFIAINEMSQNNIHFSYSAFLFVIFFHNVFFLRLVILSLTCSKVRFFVYFLAQRTLIGVACLLWA